MIFRGKLYQFENKPIYLIGSTPNNSALFVHNEYEIGEDLLKHFCGKIVDFEIQSIPLGNRCWENVAILKINVLNQKFDLN